MTDHLEVARTLTFQELDSTNDEAFRRFTAGEQPPFWIRAARQTRGRGRNGRAWCSNFGNLHASHLLTTPVPPSDATQLSFVAALAAYDTAVAFLPAERCLTLGLKWPNDLLAGGAKLAGVLLESMTTPQGNLAVVLGIGMNVSQAPDHLDRAATSLGLTGASVDGVFITLAVALRHWLGVWNEGFGFPTIREVWTSRAIGLNGSIAVTSTGEPLRGTFLGLNASGALQVETSPGVVISVTAGDIDVINTNRVGQPSRAFTYGIQ